MARAADIDPAEAARYQYVATADSGSGRAAAAHVPAILFVEEKE